MAGLWGCDLNLDGPGTGQHPDTVAFQSSLHDLGGFGVFSRKQLAGGLDDRDLGAEPGKRLAQLTAERPTAQDHQSGRQLLWAPKEAAVIAPTIPAVPPPNTTRSLLAVRSAAVTGLTARIGALASCVGCGS